MNKSMTLIVTFSAGLLVLSGCKKNEPPAPETPNNAPLAESAKPLPPVRDTDQLPPGHPPIGQPAEAPRKDGLPAGHPPINPTGKTPAAKKATPIEAPTHFAGITLTPPKGWEAVDASGGMMAPVAVFVLPGPEGKSAAASARLTHFPSMKNIPIEQNLERWYGQVQQPDGKSTKEVAKVDTFKVGGVQVTLVDMTGTIGGQTGYRMIAAQIDHPRGPHFLKVTGPADTVAQWRDSVIEYLKSAKVTP